MKKLTIFILLLWMTSFIASATLSNANNRISEEKAKALALNKIKVIGDEVVLSNPKHKVVFSSSGVKFIPKNKAPEWHWQLIHANFIDGLQTSSPTVNKMENVIYNYDAIIEKYILKTNTIEQQFILGKMPETDSEKIIITGSIYCDGIFSESVNGWEWENDNGKVFLGKLTVFDANNRIIPSEMFVSKDKLQIDGM